MKFGVDNAPELHNDTQIGQTECGFKRLRDDVHIPKRATDGSAGYDLYAIGASGESEIADFVEIPPHETAMIHTGLAVNIPHGYFGAIFARSGIAVKQGLRPANCVGVVDEDYGGEIMVALRNDTNEERIVEFGSRIAQIVFIPYYTGEMKEVDHINDTERGAGGFGSTGEK